MRSSDDKEYKMGTGGKIKLEEGTAGGLYVGFKAPDTDIVSDTIWSLPSTDGHPGQMLGTDGAQNLIWIDESGLRFSADSSLQGNINSETTARMASDSSLQMNLNSEISSRMVTDSNLSNEITARTNADLTLQANINSETTSRMSADSSLISNLNSETSFRLASDSTLTTNLNSEISSRTSNDNLEITARSNADLTLQANINSEQSARLSADSSIKSVGIGSGNGTAGSGTIGGNNLKVDLAALTSDWDTTGAYISVKTPSSNAHAATKQYVDGLVVSGGTIKEALLSENQLKAGASAGILGAEVIFFNTNPSINDTVILKNAATTETYTFVTSRSTSFQVTIGVSAVATMTNLASAITSDSASWNSVFIATGLDKINAVGCTVVIDNTASSGTSSSRIYGTWSTQTNCQVVEFYDIPEYRTSKAAITLPASDPAAGRFGLRRQLADLLDGEIHDCLATDVLRTWHYDSLIWITLASALPEATAASGGGLKGKVTFDSDLGLDVISGVAKVKIDNSSIKFNGGGQLYADQGNLNYEITARSNADLTLQANINSETTSRMSADSSLTSNLNSEISSRMTADSSLTSNLNSETTSRMSADSTLQTNLNNKVTGPASSVDASIARFDGTTGKLLKGYTSGAPTINDTGNVTVNGSFTAGSAFIHKYSAITSATVLDGTYCYVSASGSSTYAVTLPTAIGIQGLVYIIKSNMNAGILLTINTTSTQTIDGATSVTLSRYSSLQVISNGANWEVF